MLLLPSNEVITKQKGKVAKLSGDLPGSPASAEHVDLDSCLKNRK